MDKCFRAFKIAIFEFLFDRGIRDQSFYRALSFGNKMMVKLENSEAAILCCHAAARLENFDAWKFCQEPGPVANNNCELFLFNVDEVILGYSVLVSCRAPSFKRLTGCQTKRWNVNVNKCPIRRDQGLFRFSVLPQTPMCQTKLG